jgi:hypothetical protein
MDNLMGHCDAIDDRHANIHQNHVGLQLADLLDGRKAIDCFIHYAQIGLQGEKLAQTFTHQGVIVNQQDADRVNTCSRGSIMLLDIIPLQCHPMLFLRMTRFSVRMDIHRNWREWMFILWIE